MAHRWLALAQPLAKVRHVELTVRLLGDLGQKILTVALFGTLGIFTRHKTFFQQDRRQFQRDSEPETRLTLPRSNTARDDRARNLGACGTATSGATNPALEPGQEFATVTTSRRCMRSVQEGLGTE